MYCKILNFNILLLNTVANRTEKISFLTISILQLFKITLFKIKSFEFFQSLDSRNYYCQIISLFYMMKKRFN